MRPDTTAPESLADRIARTLFLARLLRRLVGARAAARGVVVLNGEE